MNSVSQRHHADLVALVEQVDDEVGGLLGQVELGDLLVGGHRHRARAIDRQHHGQAGDLHLLLDVHGDGQRFLDRRAVVAAEAEALLAAQHHEPAAVIADIVADLRHLRPRELQRRHVREDHAVVLLEPGDVLRNPRRLHDGHVDVLRAQGGRPATARASLSFSARSTWGRPRTTTVPTARLLSSMVSPSTSMAAW